MLECTECNRQISKVEYEEFNGVCLDCFEELAKESFEQYEIAETARRR